MRLLAVTLILIGCASGARRAGPSPDCPNALDNGYSFDPSIQVGATRYGVCWDGT